jgi:VWFA-related protein
VRLASRPSPLTPFFLLAAFLLIADIARAQTDERTIYASVVTSRGEPVLDLGVKDFVVREDGQAREILSVARDNDPLQIALLADNSNDMRTHVPDLRKALGTFVDAVREGVPIALITLAERPTIAVGYTTDRGALHKAVDKLFAFQAGNYLLDGIAETSQGLAKRTLWRSAIVVISGSGQEYSYRQYTEVLRFFREGGASLSAVILGTGNTNAGREIVLSRGSLETGGRYENIISPTALELKARQVAVEVSNQYRVTYARPARLIPPKQTEVSVKRQDLKARGMPMKTEKDQR